jgi:hypothetical protein
VQVPLPHPQPPFLSSLPSDIFFRDLFAFVTAHKNQSLKPAWNSFRSLGGYEPTDILNIELWDRDELSKDDLFGKISFPVASINSGQPVPIRFKSASCSILPSKKTILNLSMLQQLNTIPKSKKLYIVRHGESMWNKAQSDKNVIDMM